MECKINTPISFFILCILILEIILITSSSSLFFPPNLPQNPYLLSQIHGYFISLAVVIYLNLCITKSVDTNCSIHTMLLVYFQDGVISTLKTNWGVLPLGRLFLPSFQVYGHRRRKLIIQTLSLKKFRLKCLRHDDGEPANWIQTYTLIAIDFIFTVSRMYWRQTHLKVCFLVKWSKFHKN